MAETRKESGRAMANLVDECKMLVNDLDKALAQIAGAAVRDDYDNLAYALEVCMECSRQLGVLVSEQRYICTMAARRGSYR